jgi:hypothetical protein
MNYPSVIAESAVNDLDGLSVPTAPRTRDGRFRNPVKMHQMGFLKGLSIMLRFAFDKPKDTVPTQPIPVHAITQQQLLDAPDRSLFRLGHSTVLLKLNGNFWLTDPVFSERASPVQWAGPQRFHKPPISIEELPPIKGVILSHDQAAGGQDRAFCHAARRGRSPDFVGRAGGQGAAAELVGNHLCRRAEAGGDAGAALLGSWPGRPQQDLVGVVCD